MQVHPLDRLPSLRTIPKRVPAPVYNTLRVVLLRSGADVRLPLPHLGPALWALVDGRGWVVLDGLQEDLPLLAWTGFPPKVQRPLHEAVPCELRVFHRCAGMIMGEGLEALHHAGARHLGRGVGGAAL